MKRIAFSLLVAVFTLSLVSPVSAKQKSARSTVVRRGDAVPGHQAITLGTLIAKPESFTAEPVVIAGVIDKACTKKGCWMQLADKKGSSSAVRITFKDYGFFVPLTSAGMRARAIGVAEVKTLSASEAEHLVGEGAQLIRNADGTAREISFVASGVELKR
ncbi:MAG TPA: DUF4920 domain-containing protein [Thermoanaerobaculia bacterium]|nr:DUF4920 domain-containing protein [Thermoanaerobaculia bacterium]